MRMSLLEVLAFSIVLQSFVYCHENEGDTSQITELTPENFDDSIKKSTVTFHLFYADWCGHCKKLMPSYNDFCGHLKKIDSNVLCSKLNCNIHKELCGNHNVKGFPSLQRFANGKTCVYSGERDIDNLLKWYEQSMALLHEVSDVEPLAKHIGDSGEPLVVAYFKKSGSELEDMLINSTCDASAVKVSLIRNTNLASKLGVPDRDGVYVVRSGKVEKEFDRKHEKSDEIGRFLFLAGHDVLPEYSIKNSQSIFSPFFNSYLTVVFDPKEKETAEILKSVESIASKHTGKVRFFKTDVSQTDSKNVVEFFKLKKFPTICYYDHEANKFYHYDLDEITHDNIIDFLNRCLEGKTEPYRAREPMPDDWEKTPVKTLVVDNFELAKSRNKNMFVMFYAPWCGHCKSMKPAWNALGEHFKNDNSVMVAHMDATQNDMPELNIQGFPTLKVFKTDGQVIDYNGGRSFEELKEYIINGFTLPKESDKASQMPDSPHEEL